jgi:hypothetical protein
VLRGLELRAHGDISTDELALGLRYVESFLVRRMIVAKPNQGLNLLFADMLGALTGDSFAESVRNGLSRSRRHWPTDDALRASIASSNFYWVGRSAQRTYVLEQLLATFEGREAIDFAATKFTIEHVLPQSPSHEQWQAMLQTECVGDETVDEVHSQVVHTLGNLTLTAYNSEMSNDPFSKKRKVLAESALAANRVIASNERWGRAEIAARASDLTERAIGLWPSPSEGASETGGKDWTQLHALLAAIPSGKWTSYIDVAQVFGSQLSAAGPVQIAMNVATRSSS